MRFIESPEGQELAALCLDYGYKLANSPRDLTRLQINFLMAALANRIKRSALVSGEEPGVTKFVFAEDDDV